MREKASDILFRRLRDECELEIPEGTKIIQIRAGEWRWRLSMVEWGNITGSLWTVTELAKAKGKLVIRDVFGDQEIWIDEKANKEK